MYSALQSVLYIMYQIWKSDALVSVITGVVPLSSIYTFKQAMCAPISPRVVR